jgi:hypothetical protein
VIFSGGDFERWDLHVRGGMLGSMRMRMAVEEHGGGRQLLRIRSWPRFSRIGAGVALAFAALATGAALSGVWVVAAVMAFVVAVIVTCVVKDCATAAGVLTTVLEAEAEEARREFEPEAEPSEPLIAMNGHGPDGALEHEGALTTNGAHELQTQNVPLGAPLRMSERRVEFRDGDK